MSRDAIICDLDGTLADVAHRRHHVSGQHKNWDAFFRAMGDDPVIEPVLLLLQAWINHHGANSVYFTTGRPEEYRDVTVAWLRNIGLPTDNLFMRADGDYRADHVVKRQMLEYIRRDGTEVRFVVDDRQTVVDMWREEGLICLQAAKGDFDHISGGRTPGELHLLIGPAGAGKSTFAEKYFKPGEVVSSDQLREQLSGTFLDQSRNEEVFGALRGIAAARVTNGLRAVVDATNIRNKDRTTLLKIAPHDSKVVYHVINRGMPSKQATAGWRAEVVLKDGASLLEGHERTFKANLKAILAGDGDPRVEVIDHRFALASGYGSRWELDAADHKTLTEDELLAALKV